MRNSGSGSGSWSVHSSLAAGDKAWAGEGNTVERVVVAGVLSKPSEASVRGTGSAVDFEYDAGQQVLTLRRVGVPALQDWVIDVQA